MTRAAKANFGHDPSRDPKHVEEWDRPPEVKPGVTLAYKILTPSGAATTPLPANEKPFIPIQDASSARANETLVLIVRPGLNLQINNADLLWTTAMSNGETIALINHEIDMPEMPPPATGPTKFARGKSRDDLTRDGLRVLIFSNDQNGHRIMIDAPAKYQP